MKAVFPGAFKAHWFQFFNSVAFQVMLGAPLVVYAKSLGASSTVLGLLSSFTPLLNIFQLPAARHLGRYGYRRFILMGWTVRSMLIFFAGVIPLLSFLDNTTKLVLLTFTLFSFNLMKGISSAAWLPWITELVPVDKRGRYFSYDHFFSYTGSLVSLGASSAILYGTTHNWSFALVFLFSGTAATLSLECIKRIPDVPITQATRTSAEKVPWRNLFLHPPFLNLIVFNMLYLTVIGSLGVFTVEYLRDMSHFNVSEVLYLTATTFIGSMALVPFLGRLTDQVGSKPITRFALLLFGLVIFCWLLLSAGVIPTRKWIVALLYLLSGCATAAYNLANMRLLMVVVPQMGRNHFYALYSVVTSLGLGATPIAWGLILDWLGSYEAVTGAFHWRRHSIYFLALLCICFVAFLFTSRLRESSAPPKSEAALS